MLNGRKRYGIFGLGQSATSPIDESDACDTLPPRITATLCLTVILTSLTLSFLLAGMADAIMLTSIGACLLSCVVIFSTSDKISGAIWKILGLAFCVSLFGYPVIPALLYGGVISVGAVSAFITSAKKRTALIPILLPVIAYAISLFVTSDPIVSISVIVPFLPAIPMGLTSRKGAGMTSSIVSAAAVLLGLVAATAAFTVYIFYGEVSPDSISLAIEDITSFSIAYTEQTLSQFGGIEYTEAMKREFSAVIETYVNSAVGLAMAGCVIAAFAAIRVQHSLFKSYEMDEYLTPKATTVTVSVPAAIIFATAHVLSFSLDSSNNLSIVGVVAGNICIALTPGLIFMSIVAVKELPKKLGGLGAILSIALILIIMFLVFTYPTFIASVGAIYVIAIAVDAWAKDFYSKGDNK